ncbi:hypothetical protein QN362_16835 [Actimicrobium sp. CCC2.4]|uniref:DUF6683 family protein n=1 Tax=Actimicrobium sp. CCC2.4 TaxID=3048606 RepID=UPI002AC8CF6C|nr:DUF6683 family protein [Actimicrobium sp. CCC2.4]MEB0137004.1 hypothetical protein [Actimicrobium sp. CCC2.4]WPX32258.1 hypothetical protein RHM62_18880 [Actimicrobium sp. CCC2.4]
MKMTFVFIRAALAGFIVALFASPAMAQYDYYQSSSFLSNQFNYPSLAPSPGEKWSQPGSTPKKRGAEAPPPASGNTNRRASTNNNPLPYSRDKALSVQIRETFLRDFAKQMPDAVDDIREAAEKTDLVQAMAGFAQIEGLDSGTMEGMMALWYGQAWAIANQQPMPSKQQYQGIANQLRKSMKNSPQWSQMNSKQRQEFIEQLAYPLIVQKANYQAYLKQGKKDSMARMSAATHEGLKKIGLHLRNLKLSNNGFVG